MKILLISPLGFPVNSQTRYAGIEQLVWNFTSILCKDHDVTVLDHSESQFPPQVKRLSTDTKGLELFISTELKQYTTYQSVLRTFDVIHDFSHQQFASRFNPNLPSLNVFWHAPNEVQYPKAPYNIIGLSKWACVMFERYYHHKARFQETIALDTVKYRPSEDRDSCWCTSFDGYTQYKCSINDLLQQNYDTYVQFLDGEPPSFDAWKSSDDKVIDQILNCGQRTNRFLTLGRMAPAKGNLEAAKLCAQEGVPLDIVGQPDDAEYVKEVLNLCDGTRIKYLGEVSESEKITLMQTCKALIYCLTRPEVTSHKIQEAMLCGAPVITSDIGALPEIITHGVDGFLCRDEGDWPEALKRVEDLKPAKTYDALKKRYNLESVVGGYVSLYKQVAKGLRW